ncbi:MAG TPA: hypothetical protein VF641_03830 [Methylobacterium sp.]|jgi:hypothetical protein
MKIVAHNHAAQFGHSGHALTQFSETMLLAKIGDDLRGLYADVTDASQPDELMHLAHLIDERRGESAEG